MVLLVDDDPNFLLNFHALYHQKHPLLMANGSYQARQLAQKIGSEISVALVDLDLHEHDGFSLIRELHERFPNLAIIAISGIMQPEVLESARALGAVEVLRKPITPEWTDTIDRHLNGDSLTTRGEEKNGVEPAEGFEPPTL